MNFSKRGEKYSFFFYDPLRKTNVRLKQSEHPLFIKDEEAAAFCQQWNLEHQTRKTLLKNKYLWKELAPEMIELLYLYETARKEDAEFSWKTSSHYLKCYAFPYFIEEKGLRDFKEWPKYFEPFRHSLEKTPRINRKKEETTLSYSTMNAVIKALNNFFVILTRWSYIGPVGKCRLFSKYKMKVKGEECVFSSKQSSELYEALLKKSNIASSIFLASLHTGMRMSELLGLSLMDFCPGSIDNKILNKCLEFFPYKVYGYFTLDSQPLLTKIRDAEGDVPRKPLKGKRKISGANSRTIPVFDQRCFDLLVSLWNEQRLLFEKKRYGLDPRNYLLFQGMTRNQYYTYFVEAKNELHFSYNFTPHDARHSFSTWLAEESGCDVDLCRMVLGHSSVETTLGYVHMSSRIQNQLRSKIQLQMPMNYSDEKVKTVSLLRPRKG